MAKLVAVLAAGLLATLTSRLPTSALLINLTGVPDHGLVLAHVDLTAALQACQIDALAASELRAVDVKSRAPVPVQLVPDPDFDPAVRCAGMLAAHLPHGGAWQLAIRPGRDGARSSGPWDGVVTTPYVSETVRQQRVKTWKELHFLELNFSDKSFATWMGAAPAQHARFANSAKSHRFSKWGAISDGANTIAMLQAGQVLVYDGDGYGRYLHARGTQAWQPWDSSVQHNSAWLWIDSVEQPTTAVEQFIPRLPSTAAVVVTTDHVERALADARESDANSARWWRIAAAEQLRSAGRYAAAIAAAHGHLPDEMVSLTAGALGMLVSRANHCVELLALFDTRTNRRLSAAAALPLFELVLHDMVNHEQVTLRANTEWQGATLDVSDGTLTATWEAPTDRRLTGLRVVVHATARAADDALAWDIKVQHVPSTWTLWEVVFPQLAAADPGSNAQLFLPIGCGTVKRLAENRGFRSKTRYPSGWTSMQFMGLYDLPSATGLYVANHDPWGSTKTLIAQINDPQQGTTLGFAYPVPNMGKPANGFESSGQVVWRLLRGDWFDAALFYRDWVRGNDDFEFSRIAKPAATKDVNGKVYFETYGSKEADGAPVKLAVMCPATDTWQQRVGQLVGRLMQEYGVRGVYLDQIAAAQPRLCFDASHGHPLGGGHWWTEAYWQLVQRIRRQMPADRMLTTECNAEPYIHCFDGYLTWHWQYDGQVPTVTADWQWHGEWPVTTPAVLTGAWRIPHERRAVLLFVNVSKQPVHATVRVNPADYLPGAKRVRLTVDDAEGDEVIDANDSISHALQITGEAVIAWRLESE